MSYRNAIIYGSRLSPQAGWIPAPLSFVGELFPSVSTGEVHLLLAAVHTFLKVA